MGMEIKNAVKGEITELVVEGRVDGPGANRLEEEILKAMRAGAAKVYVNLAGSDFLSSSGVRVLLQYFKQMRQEKKSLFVTQPSSNVESILALTGLKDLTELTMRGALARQIQKGRGFRHTPCPACAEDFYATKKGPPVCKTILRLVS